MRIRRELLRSLTVLTHAIVEEALWALSSLVTNSFSTGFSLDPRSFQSRINYALSP